ncbi:MAG: hypothetical protein AB7Q97_16635 [Gammaproteobacteria bacterium]
MNVSTARRPLSKWNSPPDGRRIQAAAARFQGAADVDPAAGPDGAGVDVQNGAGVQAMSTVSAVDVACIRAAAANAPRRVVARFSCWFVSSRFYRGGVRMRVTPCGDDAASLANVIERRQSA